MKFFWKDHFRSSPVIQKTNGDKSMKRREFFKKAGAGSAALASLSTLGHTLATPARADDDEDKRTGFRFVCVSQAGTTAGVVHRINMNGGGTFNASHLDGGGSY